MAIDPYQIPDYSFGQKDIPDYTFTPYQFSKPSYDVPYRFTPYQYAVEKALSAAPKPGVAYGGMPQGSVPKPAAVPVTGSAGRRYGGAQRASSSSPALEALRNPVLDVGAEPTGMTYQEFIDALGLGQDQRSTSGPSGPSRQEIADAIARMVEGAKGARTEIGAAYDTATSELDKMIQDYAAAMAGQQAGAGRTLQAFGVDPSQLDVGGMSAQDLLVAQRANLVAQKAAQDAALADRIAAYQTLMGA